MWPAHSLCHCHQSSHAYRQSSSGSNKAKEMHSLWRPQRKPCTVHCTIQLKFLQLVNVHVKADSSFWCWYLHTIDNKSVKTDISLCGVLNDTPGSLRTKLALTASGSPLLQYRYSGNYLVISFVIWEYKKSLCNSFPWLQLCLFFSKRDCLILITGIYSQKRRRKTERKKKSFCNVLQKIITTYTLL